MRTIGKNLSISGSFVKISTACLKVMKKNELDIEVVVKNLAEQFGEKIRTDLKEICPGNDDSLWTCDESSSEDAEPVLGDAEPEPEVAEPVPEVAEPVPEVAEPVLEDEEPVSEASVSDPLVGKHAETLWGRDWNSCFVTKKTSEGNYIIYYKGFPDDHYEVSPWRLRAIGPEPEETEHCLGIYEVLTRVPARRHRTGKESESTFYRGEKVTVVQVNGDELRVKKVKKSKRFFCKFKKIWTDTIDFKYARWVSFYARDGSVALKLVKEFKKKNKSTTVPATHKNKPVAKITNPFASFQDEEPEQEPTVVEPVPVVEPVVQKPEQEPIRTPEQEPVVQKPEEPAEPVDKLKVIRNATQKVRSTYPKWKKALPYPKWKKALETREEYEEVSEDWKKLDKKAARILQKWKKALKTRDANEEDSENWKKHDEKADRIRQNWKKALKTRDAEVGSENWKKHDEEAARIRQNWKKHEKKAARFRQTIRDNFNHLLRFHEENQIVEDLAQKYGNHVWRDLKEICPDFVCEFPELEETHKKEPVAKPEPTPITATNSSAALEDPVPEQAPVVETPGMVEVGAQIRQPVVRESENKYVCCDWVHCGKSCEGHAHDLVGRLAGGQVISVAEIIGNRARIVSPMQGWITIRNSLGNAKIVPLKDMPLECTTTTGQRVLAEQDYDSAEVDFVHSGEVVQVAEIQGIRARIVSPVSGWISTKNIDKEDMIVQVQTNRKRARSLSQEQDSSSQSSQSVGRPSASRSGSIASRF